MKHDIDNNVILTIKEIMETLQVGRLAVYKLIQSGELKAVKIAGKYRTTQGAIFEYLNTSMESAHFQRKKPSCYNQTDCSKDTR